MGDKKDSPDSGPGILFKIITFLFLVLLPATIEYSILSSTNFVPTQWIGIPFLLSVAFLFGGAGYLIVSKNPWFYIYSLVIGSIITAGIIGIAGLAYLFTITLPFGINAGFLAVFSLCIVLFTLYYIRTSMRATTGTTSITGLIAPSTKNQVAIPSRSGLGLFRRRPVTVAGVELEEIPRAYVFPEEGKEPLDLSLKFLNIVRHLSLTGINFSLRIERRNRRTRVLFLTWADTSVKMDHQNTMLLDTLRSNLSGFRFQRIYDYEGVTLSIEEVGASVEITGVPLSIEDEKQEKSPLDSVAAVMQELDNGILQIFVEDKKDQRSELKREEAKYQRLIESSETTVTKEKSSWFQGNRQESKRIVNAKAQREAELTKRKIERYSGSQLCEVRVVAVSWADKIEQADIKSRRIAGAVMGSVRPDSTQDDLKKLYRRKQKDIAKLLRGISVGVPTTLTPGEVASYFILPKTDMGVRITSRQRFSSGTKQSEKSNETKKEERAEKKSPTPKEKKDPDSKADWFRCDVPTSVKWNRRPSRKVFHGPTIGENGKPIENAWLASDPSYYDGHFLMVGTTRQGKTTTALSMTAQLISLGIDPVVFVPAKAYDWRILMEIFPDIRVFKAGSLVSQLGYNFWNPPPNVDLSKWVDMVVSVICLWLPTDKVITMHVEDWVYTIYKLCGWDIDTGKIGRPILFQDIVKGVLEFRKDLNYDEEVNRNFYGALVARVKSLLRKPALVRMFNTKGGITIPELLAHPTIIEMEGLSPKDRVLLMGMLTAAISEYMLANPTKKVKNVLILEEAHYLLGKADIEGSTNSSSRQKAVLTLVEMLRVLGGTGLGMILIEQLPSTLVEEAMKLPVNLIIHRLKEDRETTRTIGEHAGCTDKQIQHLRGMKRGEVVIYVETEGEPKNVQIAPLQRLIVDRLREDPPTDAEVKAHMKPVFEKYPKLASSEPLPEGLMELLVKKTKQDVGEFKDEHANDPVDEFEFLFRNEKVAAYCREHIRLGTDEALRNLAESLILMVKKELDGEIGTVVRLAERVVRAYCEENCDHIRSQLNYKINTQVDESE